MVRTRHQIRACQKRGLTGRSKYQPQAGLLASRSAEIHLDTLRQPVVLYHCSPSRLKQQSVEQILHSGNKSFVSNSKTRIFVTLTEHSLSSLTQSCFFMYLHIYLKRYLLYNKQNVIHNMKKETLFNSKQLLEIKQIVF